MKKLFIANVAIAFIFNTICIAQDINASITIQSISTVNKGSQLTVRCNVTNTGIYSWSFGIGAEINDGSTRKADLGIGSTSTIAPGVTKVVTFSYTIPTSWESKNYTAHAVAWLGTPGLSDWLDDDNEVFTVTQATVIDASISIQPISSVVQGNQLSVTCNVQNTGNTSRSFGVGAEIYDGNTRMTDLGTRTTSTISPGSSSSVSFIYTIPTGWTAKDYTAHAVVWSDAPGYSDWLNDDNETLSVEEQIESIAANLDIQPFTSIITGNILLANCKIENTGSSAGNFDIKAKILDGNTIIKNLDDIKSVFLEPGEKKLVTFMHIFPLTYLFKKLTINSSAWGVIQGLDKLLDNDDEEFTISNEKDAFNSGRIAYHSYSKYLAIPEDGDNEDGNIFVYDVTEKNVRNITYNSKVVVNAMNPHFSPDGSKIVFMGIPYEKRDELNPDDSSLRLLGNIDIFIYDFYENKIISVSDANSESADEDPKFSPDGTHIIFKRNGQIYKYNFTSKNIDKLTNGGYEKSGPIYSPKISDERILFWSTTFNSSDEKIESICMRKENGEIITLIQGDGHNKYYYPMWQDENTIFFTNSNNTDDIYTYSFSTDLYEKTSFNSLFDDSDCFLINEKYLGFSSNRQVLPSFLNYCLYYVDLGTGVETRLPLTNTKHDDLGGAYSQHSSKEFARKEIEASTTILNFGNVEIGETKLLNLNIKNIGNVSIESYANIESPFSIYKGANFSLAPGQEQEIAIKFQPQTQGEYVQNISFSGLEGFSCVLKGEGENIVLIPIIQDIIDHEHLSGSPYLGPNPVLNSGTSPITWSLLSAPSGVTINNETGMLSWENPVVSSSPYLINIQAQNSTGSDTESWYLTISSESENVNHCITGNIYNQTNEGTKSTNVDNSVILQIIGDVESTISPNTDGSYSFLNLNDGNYTIIPFLEAKVIYPDTLKFLQLSDNKFNQNFIILDNSAPLIEDQKYIIEEHSPVGSLIGKVYATDYENDNLTYSIKSGNEQNLIIINSSTGDLYVNDSILLEYDRVQLIPLDIEVTDDGIGNLSSNAKINIDVSENYETGVKDFTMCNNIKVYPNPCSEILFINFENDLYTGTVYIKLIDITGKVIISDRLIINNGLTSMNIPEKFYGFYFLQVRFGHKIFYEKIIVR